MVRIIREEAPLSRNEGGYSRTAAGELKASLLPASTFLSARQLHVSGDTSNMAKKAAVGTKEASVVEEETSAENSLAGVSRRRAAKATAMTALSITAHREIEGPAASSSKLFVDPNMPHPSKNPARKGLARAPPLDFTTVRTAAPAILPSRNRARLFDLEHCPIFYPTIEEFAQPIDYIERVAKESKDNEFGMCKIVPPEGWKPPFALDTEVCTNSCFIDNGID